MKTLINNEEIEFCKFIDLTNEKNRENINMNILDRSTEELFRSINLEDVDSESEQGVMCLIIIRYLVLHQILTQKHMNLHRMECLPINLEN